MVGKYLNGKHRGSTRRMARIHIGLKKLKPVFLQRSFSAGFGDISFSGFTRSQPVRNHLRPRRPGADGYCASGNEGVRLHCSSVQVLFFLQHVRCNTKGRLCEHSGPAL